MAGQVLTLAGVLSLVVAFVLLAAYVWNFAENVDRAAQLAGSSADAAGEALIGVLLFSFLPVSLPAVVGILCLVTAARLYTNFRKDRDARSDDETFTAFERLMKLLRGSDS